MAKKSVGSSKRTPRTNRRTQRAESLIEIPSINSRSLNFKNVLRKISGNPLSLYLAGGIGAFFAGRFALRYYRGHPEISSFLRENFDTVESKLREYKNNIMSDSDIDERVSRH